ncbi:hypothetical protein LTR08_006945 [Meristemomyces frigidus]|nr:hypothetical protein LTR08_006945 [Meristemomyces frigidus]
MLVRSAGRRRQRHTAQLLAASYAQLNLPWLAPAQLRWTASQASVAVEAHARPRRNSHSTPRHAKAQTRRLATAADQYTPTLAAPLPPPGLSVAYRNNADNTVPWDFARKSQPLQDCQPRFSTVRPYSDPIILNTTLQNPEKLIKVQKGVHGNTMDLLQHLHTSLRVGRFSRAEAIIQRLGETSPLISPELQHAHTVYLGEHLRVLASHGKEAVLAQETLKKMQRWFEVEVRSKGVQPDARMLVIMIRAAIRAMDGDQRDRAIRRYAEWAESIDEDTHEEVLYSEDYDDNEFTILGRATSDLFETDGETTSEEAASQQTVQQPPDYSPRLDQLYADLIPEVLMTEQKGDGLARVKQAVQAFDTLPALPGDAPIEAQRARAYERQQLIEDTSVNIAVERWQEADKELRKIGIHTAMQTRPIAALMWQWYAALLPVLKKELAEVKKLLGTESRFSDERYTYGPLLELLPIEKFAANTIIFVMGFMAKGKNHHSQGYDIEIKLSALTLGLAAQLEDECFAEASKAKLKAEQKSMARAGKAHARRAGRKPTDAWRNRSMKANLGEHLAWPLAQKAKLGAMLIQKLIDTAQMPVTRDHPRTKEKVTQMQPAFLHRAKYVLGKRLGIIKANPGLTQKLESEPLGSLIAKRMPMIVEPKPWSGWSTGGYLHYSNPILRLGSGDKSGKDYFLAADSRGDMGQVYAGLTALSKVPWKVHPGVFKVQLEAWNSGEPIGNLAPLRPNLEMPPEPAASSDMGVRREWLAELAEIHHKRAGLHSKRCFQNFQLQVARSMINETLYFPHSMDFRGRAYPIPPYLNHMGADNVRGLLVFNDGKELGQTGLRWLKIHLATVAGHDKASMDERIQFTETHLDDIYDSVRSPLEGRRWWLQAEDAWQTLAACFELTQALDSPDPTKFISTIPIQQDGTCNGLQHYAALGGDMVGARQVNLEPGDRPADVYTSVADAVREEIRKDFEQGNRIAQMLHGHITRKCVKQPVMTNVYGVTFYGAKDQVYRQLEGIFPNMTSAGIDGVSLHAMSHYVTTKIFKSLGTMFSGAQAIQHWLGQCADRIATCITPEQIKQLTSAGGEPAPPVSQPKPLAKPGPSKVASKKKTDKDSGITSSSGASASERLVLESAKPMFKSTVVWTTPLRLPVVQPYRTSKSTSVATNMQLMSLQEPQVWDPVSKRKQLQAFPPNFIHSLDATHMLLSALRCNELGMTFASIHDSFWTHACDVDQLSVVLRDAFVEMHSENIIGRLFEEFQTRYKGCMYLASVIAISPVGARITKHRMAMKNTNSAKSGELALEAERLRLMNSKDEEERKKGEAMVTPGSIMASEGDESAFAAPSEMAGQALGDMPENGGSEAIDPLSHHTAPAHTLEGVVGGSVLGTDTDALADAGSAMGDAQEDAEKSSSESPEPAKAKKAKKTTKGTRKMYVWLPIAFPKVPEKGDFDVTRLRESKYFFH